MFRSWVAGPEIYTEIKDIFIKNLKKLFWKLRPYIRKYSQIILILILSITTVLSGVLTFLNTNYYIILLINIIPWLGLIILYCINPILVKKELINKINFFILFILISIIVGVLLLIGLYFVDNEFFSDYINILLYSRSILVLSIFNLLITHFIFTPKDKENYIKFGVTICSIFMIRNSFSTLVNSNTIIEYSKNLIDSYIEYKNAKLKASNIIVQDRNLYLSKKS